MDINFEEIFRSLKEDIFALAKTKCKDYLDQALRDGESVLNELKDDLKVWAEKLAAKEEDIDDFKFFLEGQKESLQMLALKQAGIALIEVDKFKNALLNTITDSLKKLV